MSDNTRNNNTTLVWGCIGRSCALCKKDHKACNGARPCSRCIGMGWESECRDVALKPRGRPRKTRSKAKGPAATTSSKGSSINADEDDQPLSVSPSLFVTSFPFLSTTGPKGDISEKVNKLTQRLGGSHVPAVSSGLRSDAASPKVNRKRRAVGPSSACEASNKRREIVEEEEEEEEVVEEVLDCQNNNNNNNNNHNNNNNNNNTHNNDDFAVDEDEPDVEEGLIPYEMVFRVNLVSSCSSSSKKQDNNTHNNNTHNNNNKKASSSSAKTTKKKTSSCSHNNNNTHNNTRNKSPAKEAGLERKVLKQIEEEVDMGLFRLDFANASAADVSDNNTHNTHTFGSVASASAMDTATSHQVCMGSEEEMIDSFSCAEQYVQEYWQQHTHLNNNNHNNTDNNGMLDSYFMQQQQQQQQQQPQQQAQHRFSFFMDSMGITSTANASFMFLKTEPMALAQEEKLGRNPYFIRTPPQLRRCVDTCTPPTLVDCMQEDEDAWF